MSKRLSDDELDRLRPCGEVNYVSVRTDVLERLLAELRACRAALSPERLRALAWTHRHVSQTGCTCGACGAKDSLAALAALIALGGGER